MKSTLYAGAACALVLFASEATADDSSAALGLGGIQFTQSADIRMADEDLRISPKRVDIRFVFVNDSKKDIDTMVAFPLPDLNTAEFSNSPIGTVTKDPVNFVGFSVKADGHPVAVSVEQRAFYNNRDVTAVIKSVGLPVNVIADEGYRLLVALPAAKRKILVKADLADFDDNNNALPHWIVRTNFYWRQHFPAGKQIVFEQSYQPVTGQFYLGGTSFAQNPANDEQSKSYCLDGPTRAGLRTRVAAKLKADPQAGGYFFANETDYVLKTGNNWKGPIGHFRLTLDKLKPENVLSLCWDGALKKTGATTFEDVRENFAPRSDIKLLVVEDHGPGQ
ncbi:MAG TPA: DUF4424 family protein [Rhizomicrobium sp.]|nr:DUF4424 family protein [Rhizomicrobium sp.]